MRIKVAVAFIVIVGIGLATSLLFDNRTMPPAQLEKMKAVCLSCHPEVPKYSTISYLHVKKAGFTCSRCHNAVSSLVMTDNIHRGFKWLGIGTVTLALVAIIVSLSVVNRKDKTA